MLFSETYQAKYPLHVLPLSMEAKNMLSKICKRNTNVLRYRKRPTSGRVHLPSKLVDVRWLEESPVALVHLVVRSFTYFL